MVVGSDVFALDGAIAVEFHLLASDAAASSDSVGNSAFAHGQSLHFVESLALCSHSSVEDALCESYEVGIVGHEVGLALQGDDGTEAVLSLYEHATLGSLAVATLSSNSLTLLAQICHSTVHVVAFCQSLLAVCQTSARHLAELLDVIHCNFHSSICF